MVPPVPLNSVLIEEWMGRFGQSMKLSLKSQGNWLKESKQVKKKFSLSSLQMRPHCWSSALKIRLNTSCRREKKDVMSSENRLVCSVVFIGGEWSSSCLLSSSTSVYEIKPAPFRMMEYLPWLKNPSLLVFVCLKKKKREMEMFHQRVLMLKWNTLRCVLLVQKCNLA